MSQALTLPVASTTAQYDAMCRSIAAAYQVDEVKHIRDKALAIAVYAKQAKNVEAERQACEIRLRAERRCGELLLEKQKAKGGRPKKTPSQSAEVLSLPELGITHKQSANWQKLAAVPEAEFEATVKAADRPTTSGVIATLTPPKPKPAPVDDDAMWLWGRLLDFERDGLLARDPNALLATMLPHMQETTRQLAPRVAAWLGRLT